MMRRRIFYQHRVFLFTLLFIGLAGTGATYARWSDGLTLTSNVTTGLLHVVYSENTPCSAYIVDTDGAELEEIRDVNAVVTDGGKSANIMFSLPLASKSLSGETDRLIKLVCPLQPGDESTVNMVELTEVDLRQEPSEELSLEPSKVLLVTGSEEGHELSEDTVPGFFLPLDFEVFRGMEKKNGTLYAAIYLRMMDTSRTQTGEFPEELVFDEDEAPEDIMAVMEMEDEESDSYSLDAQIVVAYHCTVPLYIEQGYKEIVPLEDN